MSKMSDVQFSRSGEQPQLIETEIYKVDPLPLPEERGLSGDTPINPETKYIIFKLAKTDRNGGTYIPNIDDVINPKSKRIERIRLLSGVDSIWQKDQKDLTKEYIEKNGISIHFPRGQKFIRVPDWDKNLLDFMRACRHNIGSPNRKTGSKFEFYEYNPQAEAKAAEDKEMKEIEMAIAAKQMPEEKMKKHASFLKIPFVDEFGDPKLPQKIRADYVLYAKRNPLFFEQTMDREDVEIQYAIKKAISDARIDIGKQPGTAFWSGSMGVICNIPHDKRPVDYLTELALTNTPEGRSFKEQLKTTMT